MNMKPILLIAAAGLVVGITGCDPSKYGQVEQGRVIAFDEAEQTVTVVHDSAMDPAHPVYDVMPAVEFKLPTDPAEIGPLPKPGQLLTLDVDKKEIEIYDTRSNNLAYIPIDIIEVQRQIDKTHPLVYNDKENQAKPFPVIDAEKETITIYSNRQKLLCTFSIPAGYEDYPPSTWDIGDEVRIYFKTEGQALRFMNVSKTDIYKK